MAIRTLLHFRNPDLTADINERYVGLIPSGVFEGGTILPVVAQLKIDLTPWKLNNNDGMVVEETSATVRLDCPAGQTTVIAVQAVYVQNNAPIVNTAAIEQSAFNALIDRDTYIVMGQVTVPLGAVQVLSSYIDLSVRMSIDALGRSQFRGLVTAVGFLPASNNIVGDFYIVAAIAGLPAIYAWNGLQWFNITDAAQVSADLSAHRQNLFADEKHLTDNQKAAVVGTSGTSVDGVNKLVDNADTRIPLQTQKDAMAGSDGTPSSANLYITQLYHFAVPEEATFTTPLVNYAHLLVTQGPFYVGKQVAPSANQYFTVYDSAKQREYTTSANVPVTVLGVFLDAGLTIQLDPAVNPNVDIDGFCNNVDLYIELSTPIPDSGFNVIYGKRQTLLTLPKNSLLRRSVNDAQTSAETVQTIEQIKGRTFDTVPPTNEQNINLRRSLVDVKEYLAAVFKSDYVAFDFDTIANVPEFGSDFIPNVGIPPNYSFQNLSLVSYSYNASTGVVTYGAAVNLASVLVGHVLVDGAGVEFPVTVVGVNQVTIAARDGSTPKTVTTTIGSSASGSIKPDNNPRKVNLSTLGCIVGRERLICREVEMLPNEFHPATGNLAFGIRSPLHSPFYREPRVRFYGGWQNQGTGLGSRVVATNVGRILITGFFTDLTALVDLGTATPTITVVVDGIVGATLDPSRSGTVSSATVSANDVQMQPVTIATGLADLVPHTVELIIGNAAGNFVVYGFDLVRFGVANTLVLPGRAFVQSDLFKQDAIQTPSTPAVAVQNRGLVATRLVDRTLTLATSSYTLTDLDGVSGIPAGVATSGSPNFSVLSGLAKFSLYKVGDIVKLITATTEEVLKIQSIPTSSSIVFTSNIAGNGSCVLFHIASTLGAPLDPTHEYARFSPMDLGFGQTSDFSLDFQTPGNHTYTLEDGTTSVAATNVVYSTTGIDGIGIALQLVNAGSTLKIRAVCNKLDIMVANSSPLTASVSVDGCPPYTVNLGGSGLQRVPVLTNARYQSHEVSITNAAGLEFAGIILYEPTTSAPPQGALLSTQNELARYLVSLSGDGTVTPTGAVAIDPLTSGGTFVDNTGGAGSTNWTATLDFTRNPAYGRYITTDRAQAYFEYKFNGDGFELEYFANSDQGISRLTLNGTILTSVNFPAATMVNVNTSTGEVDMWAASATRRKIVVANLPRTRYVLQVQIENPRTKNLASTGFFLNVGTFYEVNSDGTLSVSPSRSFRDDFFYGLDTLRDERNFDSGTTAIQEVPVEVVSPSRVSLVALPSAATTVTVVFSSPMASTNYVATVNFVNTVDVTPTNQPITITNQTSVGFTAKWSTPLPTANYSLAYIAVATS